MLTLLLKIAKGHFCTLPHFGAISTSLAESKEITFVQKSLL